MVQNYRLILADIIRGYTHVKESEYGSFFIKHLNNFDIAEIDYIYSINYDKAKAKGIPTLEEKTKQLIKNDIWTSKEEKMLKDYKETLNTYEVNLRNEFLKSKRRMWVDELAGIRKDIRKLESKKMTLMGDTAENFASKTSNEEHIVVSFYKDDSFTEKLFPRDVFNEFTNHEVTEIVKIFRKYNGNFSQDNLSKVAILPAYLNMFILAPDNIYHFYGKPIIELTFYQLDIWRHAKQFQNNMSEFPNIPRDVQEDPEKLAEFVELNRNYKKAFPDNKDEQAGGGSLVGASKEDLKMLGITPEAHFDFNAELQKKGKLTKEDILKLQGEL